MIIASSWEVWILLRSSSEKEMSSSNHRLLADSSSDVAPWLFIIQKSYWSPQPSASLDGSPPTVVVDHHAVELDGGAETCWEISIEWVPRSHPLAGSTVWCHDRSCDGINSTSFCLCPNVSSMGVNQGIPLLRSPSRSEPMEWRSGDTYCTDSSNGSTLDWVGRTSLPYSKWVDWDRPKHRSSTISSFDSSYFVSVGQKHLLLCECIYLRAQEV